MTTRPHRRLAAHPRLIGVVAIVTLATAVWISYRALYGLPFAPTYTVAVDVRDAAHLVGAADVRIGGARVGQVQKITAMPDGRGHPFARLTLALKNSVHVPADSTFSVLPASILGAKYLALTPGHARQQIAAGATVPLARTHTAVELSDTFNLFDKPTTRGLRGVVIGLGDALVGRGADLNATIGSLGELLPPLTRVLGVLRADRLALGGFVDGAASTAAALAPVAPRLVSLLDHASVTFAGIDRAGPALGDTIQQLPATERVSTRTLTDLRPVLRDAARLAHGLRDGTRELPPTTRELSAAMQTTTHVLRGAPGTLADLPTVLAQLAHAGGPIRQALDQLTPTLGSVSRALEKLLPAQLYCNAGGLGVRNLASLLSDGDADGSWARALLIDLPLSRSLQQPKAASDLHANPYPHETADECEAGNEPFEPGQHIGNPAGNQSRTTEQTAPPPGVTELAQHAGIIRGAGR